jgi:hypothetical protein
MKKNSVAAGVRLLPALIVFALTLTPLPVRAGSAAMSLPVASLINRPFIDMVRAWASAPVVIEALNGRNRAAGQLPQDVIDKLDKQWRAEVGLDDQPLITSVLANPLSSYLTRVQANSVGVFTEVFVIDHNGLNAGQSAITSDYWQGDEAKFQKTYGVGPGAVFIDEPEFHAPTRTWRAQLNMTIDGKDGAPLGAITIEVNLTELERRALAGPVS